MPANFVKPHLEKYWERAKKRAEEEGHGGDYAYITGIYKKMTMNKSERFYIPADKLLKSADMPNRWPGQVPDRKALQAMRDYHALQRMPRPVTAEMMNTNIPRLSPQAVTRDLPLPEGTVPEWNKFLETLPNASNEVQARTALHAKLRAAQLAPDLRKALFVRSMDYYRDRMRKAVTIVHPDQLQKAEARGGKYHRRIPRKGGGYTYVYDPEKYEGREDAHVDGTEAAKSRAKRAIAAALEKAGKKGCSVRDLRALAKKHGVDHTSEALKAGCTAGEYAFQKNRLTKGKGSSTENPTRKGRR